jgi:hypothetical protein
VDRVLAVLGILLVGLAIGWFGRLLGSAAVPTAPSPAVAEISPQIEPGAAVEQAAVSDEGLGITLPGQALRRIVQMLQWREVAGMPFAPEDELVRDEGDYQLAWSETLIDSSRFARVEGHVNPPAPPYRSTSFGPGSLLRVDVDTGGWREVPASALSLPENLAMVFRPEGRWLVTTPEGELPQTGDLRVRFELLAHSPPALVAALEPATEAAPPEDFVAQALQWIGRSAALILMLAGAGLAWQSGTRLARPGSWLAGGGPMTIFALSILTTLAAILLAVLLARLI